MLLCSQVELPMDATGGLKGQGGPAQSLPHPHPTAGRKRVRSSTRLPKTVRLMFPDKRSLQALVPVTEKQEETNPTARERQRVAGGRWP